MKIAKYITVVIIVTALLAGCSDDDNFKDSIITFTPKVMVGLDSVIWVNFTKNYNIDIMYEWIPFETDQALNLVPPEKDKVLPYLELIQTVWMKPYIELGGEKFFKESSPKQIMFIGSLGYMEDGLYLFGQAEQGHRISIYGINDRDPGNADVIYQITHDFHHEFVHILHQRIPYPVAFQEICAGDYTINWHTKSSQDAIQAGFVSPYAMADPNEDFAEMISYFLIWDTTTWESLLNMQGSAAAISKKFKEKETIMMQYMKSNYNIDLYTLRNKVQNAMRQLQGL